MEHYMMLLKYYKKMPPQLEQILRENAHPLTVAFQGKPGIGV